MMDYEAKEEIVIGIIATICSFVFILLLIELGILIEV